FYGTVYQLTPSGNGSWTETILHLFNQDGVDGTFPYAGLTMDASGNLYGTTTTGGANGYGVVYELSPGSGGSWTEKILYAFDATHGANPFGGVVFDKAGNLYGTASAGGGSSAHCRYGCGVVYELSSNSGTWTETVLHNFTNNATDGIFP